MRSLLLFLCNRRLFDSRFYCRHEPDLGWYRFFPLLHYLRAGWREGYSPHPLFDNNWYCRRYLEQTPQNPLLHYILQGWRQGCDPHPLFRSAFFMRHHGRLLRPGQTPLALYLAQWQQAPRINELFDPSSLDNGLIRRLEHDRTTPLEHYLAQPGDPAFQPFPLFDPDYYRHTNPTAANEWPILLRHYFEHGAEEGCRPNALFDPLHYRSRYLQTQENKASLLEAALHYAEYGIAGGHRPNALFDPRFYGAQLSGVQNGPMNDPLTHYLRHGLKEGRYPCDAVASLAHKPCIGILTPVYNTEPNQLWRCVHSVLVQPYPHWQLCLVDDGSTAPHIHPLLASFAQMDSRIRVGALERNSGIAAATNRAAAMAEGEYLAFLDHDDELAPDALYQVACAINAHSPDVLYSDEALVNLESRHLDTLYKCGLNRELLRSHNHLMHFFLVRRGLFEAVGGLDPACDGAQDYDLALKLTDLTDRVHHIPRVLYHWRAHASSSSIHHEQKHYADEAGRRALQAALDRGRLQAEAETTELRFFYRARRNLVKGSLISLWADGGMPAQGKPPWFGENGVSGNEVEPLPAMARSTEIEEKPHCRRNAAAREAAGEYLCFLGSGLYPLRPEPLAALLEYAQDPAVAMAAGWLELPESLHRHRGSVPDLANPSALYYASFIRDASVHHNRFHCAQYAWAVQERLCMIRRSLFLDVGGYDPDFHTLVFAHLDLCFRLRSRGLSLVYTPYAAAGIAQDSAPGPLELQEAELDRLLLQRRWQGMLAAGDPWYNRAILTAQAVDAAAFEHWLCGEDGQDGGVPDGSGYSGAVKMPQ